MVLVLLAAATLGLVSIVAPDPTSVDQRFAKLVNDLPGLLGWFWEIASDLLVLWPLVLLVAAVVASRRLFLLRDQLLVDGPRRRRGGSWSPVVSRRWRTG